MQSLLDLGSPSIGRPVTFTTAPKPGPFRHELRLRSTIFFYRKKRRRPRSHSGIPAHPQQKQDPAPQTSAPELQDTAGITGVVCPPSRGCLLFFSPLWIFIAHHWPSRSPSAPFMVVANDRSRGGLDNHIPRRDSRSTIRRRRGPSP